MIEKIQDPLQLVSKLNEVIDYLNKEKEEWVDCDEGMTTEELFQAVKDASGINPIMEGPNPKFASTEASEKAKERLWEPGWGKEFIEGPGDVPYTNVKIKTREELYGKVSLQEAIDTQDMDIAQYTEYKRAKGEFPVKQETKWKAGDSYYRIEASDHGLLKVYTDEIGDLSYCEQNNYLNMFKTKEQAEQALAEIKQVLEKYQ